MDQASTIGLDIAKRVFQAHGADAAGRVVFRKRLTRAKLLEFFAALQQAVRNRLQLRRNVLDRSAKPHLGSGHRYGVAAVRSSRIGSAPSIAELRRELRQLQ